MRDLAAQLRALQRLGALQLPFPGAGETPRRHEMLLDIAREDLSLARLAEAHTDALAILAEANCEAPGAALYGVWASDGPQSLLNLTRVAGGRLYLDGVKRYCSGADILDRALVTARVGDQVWLVNVPLDARGITTDSSEWAAPAFAETTTATVKFSRVVLDEHALAGASGWYLSRPGFWHGALGPAACWAGGAVGLVDAARKLNRRDPHSRAHLGALEALEWGLRAVLVQAGVQSDADSADVEGQARRRALMARHLIERACTEVLDHFGRATGPQLLAFDAAVARRYAELTLYIRQCHAERDLAQIPADDAPVMESRTLGRVATA